MLFLVHIVTVDNLLSAPETAARQLNVRPHIMLALGANIFSCFLLYISDTDHVMLFIPSKVPTRKRQKVGTNHCQQ